MPDRNIKLAPDCSSKTIFAVLAEGGGSGEVPATESKAQAPVAEKCHTKSTEHKAQKKAADHGGSSQHTTDDEHHLHIVYDSEKDQAPYPDGDYIRTPSPEHTGIPAGKNRPMMAP